jgi:hypothetical protein
LLFIIFEEELPFIWFIPEEPKPWDLRPIFPFYWVWRLLETMLLLGPTIFAVDNCEDLKALFDWILELTALFGLIPFLLFPMPVAFWSFGDLIKPFVKFFLYGIWPLFGVLEDSAAIWLFDL